MVDTTFDLIFTIVMMVFTLSLMFLILKYMPDGWAPRP